MLNDNLLFDQLTPNEKSAFRGIGVKRKLDPPTRLFRFSLSEYNSPWWLSASDLPTILVDAKHKNENLGEYIRKRTAVFKHWNIQSDLIIAELNTPVYAFEGIIAPQQLGNRRINAEGKPLIGKYYTKSIFLRGGLRQFFIKGLEATYYKLVLPSEAIKITDPIDVIADVLFANRLI